jgi:NAD-dependent SIR2 family protein deacetylase
MSKESLFELIRREEVIIWIGAGFSYYAGLPTGKQLANILMENLGESDKSLINQHLTLPDIAEEFCRIKANNRNNLIKILIETFRNYKPLSTNVHEQLRLIPHIKTIITTNYDNLLETAYKQKGQVLFSTMQIPYIEKSKTQIFKVHGDLSDPKSIIITKSDYENFFKDDSDKNLFWTVIKERLVTNNIVFFGYNLEDINISAIFDKITEILGPDRKEAFLIAPKLPQHKVVYLLSKGIQYLDMTGEEFISELIENIKGHIIEDLEKDRTSADTFREFLTNINVLPSLKTENNRFLVQSLNGVDGKIEGKFDFTVINDPELIKNLSDYFSGKRFGDLEISKDKLLKANMSFGGLRLPFEKGVSRLQLKSIPRKKGVIDIRFENGFEITNVLAEAYGSPSLIEIHLTLKSAVIKFSLEIKDSFPNKTSFNYTHNDICRRVQDEIELFTFLKNLADGKRFKVFFETGSVFSNALSKSKLLVDTADSHLEYFLNLRAIENYYDIHFTNIEYSTIDQASFNRTVAIIKAHNKETIEYDWDDELSWEINSDTVISDLKQIHNGNVSLFGFENTETEVELHGHKIKIGYRRTEIPEPEIINLQSIIEKKERIVHVKSKIKKLKIFYTEQDESK